MLNIRREPPLAHSFVVRTWKERGQPQPRAPAWRFSVENPLTGERHGFNNLEALLSFLRDCLQREPEK